MLHLRFLLRSHYRLAMLLVAMALLVKAVVPMGHMVGQSSKAFTVTICVDGSGEVTQLVVVGEIQAHGIVSVLALAAV